MTCHEPQITLFVFCGIAVMAKKRKCHAVRGGCGSWPISISISHLKGDLPYKCPHTYSSLLFFKTLLSESLSASFIPSFLPLNWRKPACSSHPPSSGPSALISTGQLLQEGWASVYLASRKSKVRKTELKVSCWDGWQSDLLKVCPRHYFSTSKLSPN